MPFCSGTSLPAGNPIVFFTEERFGRFFSFVALLPVRHAKCYYFSLRGWIRRSHSKNGRLHLGELPYRNEGGWTGMAKARVGCVGSPCAAGKPTSLGT